MGPRSRIHVLKAVAAVCLLPLVSATAAARVLLTQQQALSLAFPNGEKVERRTAYLTEAQRQDAEQRGQVKIDSRVWTYYVGRSTAGVSGAAYFDAHVVRTMPEVLMVVLEPSGQVRSVEVLSFLEPDDYLPNARWLGQFKDKALKDDLVARRGIRNLGGASLTSTAAADAVRRVLAVDAVLRAQAGAARRGGRPTEKVQSSPR